MGEALSAIVHNFLLVMTGILIIMIFFSFARAIKGPRVSDRIIAVNMIGSITIMVIAILAILLGEEYLIDICLIYAMISFLAVVVLCKIYMGVYLEKKQKQGGGKENEDKEEGQGGMG